MYESKPLAEEAGVSHLLIKDDSRNPTGSFKDRPSALAVVRAHEAGAKIITTASSGNAGSALAGMCASVGMKSIIFVPVDAPPAKITQLIVYGATVVLVEGSYDDAYDLCLRAADRFGWYQRSTGYNPFMSEGKKTAALEIAEQLNWQIPDTIIVAVGDGCIIGGLWKGFNDFHRLGFIDRLPKLVAVQSDKASAIADAANSDGIVRPQLSQTIADSINVGRPRDATKAIRAIRESGGLAVKVTDDEIIASIARLGQTTGIFAEPAGAAPLAGLLRLSNQNETRGDETVLLMVTGNGLKDTTAATRSISQPIKVKPDIDLDQLYFESITN
jgi:threonine synthase